MQPLDSVPRPAAFFDRDGVINVDRGYLYRSEELELVDGAAEAVRMCNAAGRLVFIVTNQSGVARGFYDEAAVEELHRHLRAVLAAEGAVVDDIRFCPHLEGGAVAAYARACDCRKPGAGMLLDLIEHWLVDVARSFMIGDKPSDLQAAAAARVQGYLFKGGNLAELVRFALAQSGAAS